MIKQIIAVTAMNLKSLRGRFWPSLVIVIGMACVVGVMLSMLSFTVGILSSINAADDPSLAIVLSLSAQSDFGSSLPRNAYPTIADAPGIARDAAGKPLADAYVIMPVPMTNKVLNHDSTMLLRGLGPQGIALNPKLKMIAGRLFRPGARELIVGHAAQGQFAGTNLGDKVILPDGEWPIVGVFTTGDATESAFYADRDTVMTATGKNIYNGVLVRLTSPAAFETFRRAITSNPTLSVSAERLPAYVARTTALLSTFFSGVAYAVGTIMAIGAMFGALNTMYSAVSARTREIATLRALGFGRAAVVVSVISEALLLALTGALIGTAIAWALFDGNQKALGANVFNLSVSPGLVLTGIIWAMVVGLIGGLLPSIRAARLPVATATRAT
jgi:putative ABC transport system permease protein